MCKYSLLINIIILCHHTPHFLAFTSESAMGFQNNHLCILRKQFATTNEKTTKYIT